MIVNSFKLSKSVEDSIHNASIDINGKYDSNLYNTIMLYIDIIVFYVENADDGPYYSHGHKIELSFDGYYVVFRGTLKVDDEVILSYVRDPEGREVKACNANYLIDNPMLIPMLRLAETKNRKDE